MWPKFLSLGSKKEEPSGPHGKVQISARDLHERIQKKDTPQVVLLDVREQWEYHRAHIDGSILIPLRDLPKQVDSIPRDAEIVVLCHHGVRSLHAIHFLSQQGFLKLRNLMGGIDAWSQSVDPTVPRY